MKQARNLVRVGIHARQVCSFVEIALVTSPREVFQGIRAAVLPRQDMLQVERMKRIVLLA
jgi:hypothetical protein